MDLVASGSKAVTGISDGWKAGNALYDLAALVKNASSRETKKAAELLFNLAWWKRTEGYAKSAVGAVEGGAAIFLGPLSKGLTAVMTKAYEGGWSSYILRAIGSSFTSQVFSNAQVKQQVGQDSNNLAATVNPIAANGKIKDIVALCRAAIQLGMADFAKAILAAFNTLSSGSGPGLCSRGTACGVGYNWGCSGGRQGRQRISGEVPVQPPQRSGSTPPPQWGRLGGGEQISGEVGNVTFWIEWSEQ